MDDLKDRVFNHLPRGREKAVTGKELARELGEKGTRRVRLCIEQLRKEHKGVCSSNHEPYGYYLPASREECNETINVLRFGYLVEINQRIHDMEAARDDMFPQTKMQLYEVNMKPCPRCIKGQMFLEREVDGSFTGCCLQCSYRERPKTLTTNLINVPRHKADRVSSRKIGVFI